MKQTTLLTLATLALGFSVFSGTMQAHAAKDVKPMLKVPGMFYYDKAKAKSSAIGRWEKQAVIEHGMKYSSWGKAKKTSFSCAVKPHKKNGKPLWNCIAKGKPVAEIKTCASGKVKVKRAHNKETNAKASARNAWEKKAAGKYGVNYSFYKNAKNKHSLCGADSDFPGKVVCRIQATPCS